MENTRNRSQTTTIIVIAVVGLLLVCCACLVAGAGVAALRGVGSRGVTWEFWRTSTSLSPAEATEAINSSYSVSTPLSLDIEIGVGELRIEAGNSDRVEIRGTKRAFGADMAQARARLEDFRVEISQPSPGSITIRSEPPRSAEPRSPSVDLVLTVPRDANVRTVINVGAQHVTGLRGQFDLTSNVGEVWAQRIAITGSSRMSTNVGRVVVSLPSSSSFQLDARTSVGSVQCDFDLQNESSDKALVGKSLRGQVGSASSTSLTLRANTGNISVQRAD